MLSVFALSTHRSLLVYFQADGGIAEKRIVLRNAGRLPVTLQWKFATIPSSKTPSEALDTCKMSPFFLVPMTAELQPGSFQEFLLSFRPCGQCHGPVETTAELEVRAQSQTGRGTRVLA